MEITLMGLKQLTCSTLAVMIFALPGTTFAADALSKLSTPAVKQLSKSAANNSKISSAMNAQLPITIEPGATLKKVEYSDQFKLSIQMTSKTADKYSADETDSLNRFVVEKIHPFYCSYFKNSAIKNKPSLYVDLIDKKGESFFGSSEDFADICSQ